MRIEVKMALGGLAVLFASFLFTIFLYGLWMGVNGQPNLFQQIITKRLIKEEVARFNEDFNVIPLFESCLKHNDEKLAFDHCKSGAEFRLLYSINSKTFNGTPDGQYNVDLFCNSLEKHRQCMEKQANLVCGHSKHGSPAVVSIDLPVDSLCNNQVVARLRYTFTKSLQVGIVVDILAMTLLLALYLCVDSQKKKAVPVQANRNREGVTHTSQV